MPSPNVLFIAFDDLNDWVHCLGGYSGETHTPNLDRLADRGVLFSNAHCAAPVCNPSRTAVMTGIRPSTSGVYDNGHNWRQSPALANAVTIPEHFRNNGYEVFGGGKIFHALSWIKDSYGAQQNHPSLWDDYFPDANDPMPASHWPEDIHAEVNEIGNTTWTPRVAPDSENRPSFFFDWGPLEIDDEEMADSKVVDWASGLLMAEHERPFFHGTGLYRPHIPWFVPRKYFDLYPIEEIQVPDERAGFIDRCSPAAVRHVRRSWHQWILDNDLWASAIQAYLASISFADAMIGRLLEALDRGPNAENTVVVLWADHGMHLGEKEQWEKFTLWEESTRIPLMIASPGQRGKCERAVSLVDIYPTLIDVCGLSHVNGLEGESLLPQLQDPSAQRSCPAITTWGHNNHAVRSDRWRYIRYHNGDEELYDHESDATEVRDLSNESSARAIKEELSSWLPEVNLEPV